jgi:hypothetical protein
VFSTAVVRDAAPGFDTDKLWSLLRPVTDLIERGTKHQQRWLDTFGSDVSMQPYLRLA